MSPNVPFDLSSAALADARGGFPSEARLKQGEWVSPNVPFDLSTAAHAPHAADIRLDFSTFDLVDFFVKFPRGRNVLQDNPEPRKIIRLHDYCPHAKESLQKPLANKDPFYLPG